MYVHARENVEIACKEHGIFRATPDALLGKNRRLIACPKCSQQQRGERQKDDKKSFLKKAKQKHGNSYRYPDLIYIDTKTPVKIQCLRHGTFDIAPNVFLYGRGCPKCAMERRHKSRRLSEDEVQTRITKIHGDTITVALEGYLNNRQMVEANCKIHGNFAVKLSNLFSGRGCPECGRKKAADARRLTTKTWVKKAKAVHGNRYDYSKVKYETAHKLVDIICKKHGSFKCRPSNHVSSARGCPYCAKTGPKKSRAGTSAKAEFRGQNLRPVSRRHIPTLNSFSTKLYSKTCIQKFW